MRRLRPGGAGRRTIAWRSLFSNSLILSIGSDLLIGSCSLIGLGSSIGACSSQGFSGSEVVLQIALGFGAEQLQAALQVAFDGGERGLERSRDFFRGQVFLVAENECGALRLGQGGEQVFEARPERS